MSVCTFIASDSPLREVAPKADDNFYLLSFENVSDYTNRDYGVYLEWNYTEERAEQIIKYLRDALKETGSVELWHVWLMDYYEYEDSPVIHKRTISIDEMTIQDIKEIDDADIWNKPDKQIPSRPSFYCLKIESGK